MDHADIAAAAARIAAMRLRRDGLAPPLPALPVPPATVEDGYAIQDAVRTLVAPGFGAPAGWKVGSTSPAMQAYLKIAYPCAGTLYRNRVWSGGARVARADHGQLGLECEVAVRLKDRLDPVDLADRARILLAVEAVMTSIEIVEWRWRDWQTLGAPTLIADDFFSVGCVHGADNDPAILDGPASFAGGFMVDGAAQPTAPASNILGHPLASLHWLAGHLAARGQPLRGGEIVTLGAISSPLMVEGPASVVARFDGLGQATATVT